MGIYKFSSAVEYVHSVTLELVLSHSNFVLDHTLDAEDDISHGDSRRGAAIGTVEVLGIKAREVQNGFAHGLAGDGAGIYADTADGALLFDDRNSLAGLCALDSGTLASWTRTNHNQIVGLHSQCPV